MTHGAALSRWSYFWSVVLVAIGALVAAQGAFVKISGNAGWVTIVFIVLGVITSAGTGFNSYFKPGERSPKLTRVGLDYERSLTALTRRLEKAERGLDPKASKSVSRYTATMDVLLSDADAELDRLQREELAVYVAGPTRLKRSVAARVRAEKHRSTR